MGVTLSPVGAEGRPVGARNQARPRCVLFPRVKELWLDDYAPLPWEEVCGCTTDGPRLEGLPRRGQAW